MLYLRYWIHSGLAEGGGKVGVVSKRPVAHFKTNKQGMAWLLCLAADFCRWKHETVLAAETLLYSKAKFS